MQKFEQGQDNFKEIIALGTLYSALHDMGTMRVASVHKRNNVANHQTLLLQPQGLLTQIKQVVTLNRN